jgi:hypothetical protein
MKEMAIQPGGSSAIQEDTMKQHSWRDLLGRWEEISNRALTEPISITTDDQRTLILMSHAEYLHVTHGVQPISDATAPPPPAGTDKGAGQDNSSHRPLARFERIANLLNADPEFCEDARSLRGYPQRFHHTVDKSRMNDFVADGINLFLHRRSIEIYCTPSESAGKRRPLDHYRKLLRSLQPKGPELNKNGSTSLFFTMPTGQRHSRELDDFMFGTAKKVVQILTRNSAGAR